MDKLNRSNKGSRSIIAAVLIGAPLLAAAGAAAERPRARGR